MDDALRAVRLATVRVERERHGAGWGVRVAVRTGINTGEVVAGDATAGQLLVTGDAVNVAARLQPWPRRGRSSAATRTSFCGTPWR